MSKLLGIAMYDKIRGMYCSFTFCENKALYIRNNVESAIAQCKNLNDLTPTVLCEYDVNTGEIIPHKEEFSFSEYKMPTTRADALAPLGVDFAHEALEFQEYREWKKKQEEEKSSKE